MHRVIPGIVAAAGALLIAGCGGSEIPRSEELVPEGSNVIGRLELSGALADEDIAQLYASAPKGGGPARHISGTPGAGPG